MLECCLNAQCDSELRRARTRHAIPLRHSGDGWASVEAARLSPPDKSPQILQGMILTECQQPPLPGPYYSKLQSWWIQRQRSSGRWHADSTIYQRHHSLSLTSDTVTALTRLTSLGTTKMPPDRQGEVEQSQTGQRRTTSSPCQHDRFRPSPLHCLRMSDPLFGYADRGITPCQQISLIPGRPPHDGEGCYGLPAQSADEFAWRPSSSRRSFVLPLCTERIACYAMFP
jgi:hypothetical protein